MSRIFIVFLIVFSLPGFSQGFINRPKNQVKREVEKVYRKDTLHVLLRQTDTSLHFSVRDPRVLPADYSYTFDGSGKCKEETIIANCDSCFNKFLQSALHNKRYRWIKLNDRLYISGFAQKRLLEIPVNTEHTYTIRRTEWTRQTYKALLTGK